MKYFLILSFLVPLSSFSETGIATISSIEGNPGRAFVLDHHNKLKTLTKGDIVQDKNDIIVETGTMLKLHYLNAQSELLLNGGTQIKFMNNKISLIRGSLWSKIHGNELMTTEIVTPNAFISYLNGEFVITHDLSNEKTQVFVLNGIVNFGNILKPESFVQVPLGKVSQVSDKIQEGYPRVPMAIGERAFKKVVSSFNKEDGLLSSRTRGIASISEKNVKPVGKIIFIEEAAASRKIASLPAPKKEKIKKIKLTNAPVRYFEIETKVKRDIASINLDQKKRELASEKKKIISEIDQDFTTSLMKEDKNQERHPSERLKLIQELQSVDQQFDRGF